VACPQFIGCKLGYVYKKGTSGLGYYKDKYLRKEGSLSSKSIIENRTRIGMCLPFSYDCRETINTISMLVQVPNIICNTVSINCTGQHVRVSFQANRSENVIPSSERKLDFIQETDVDRSKLINDNYLMTFKFVAARVDPKLATHDVARNNMAIVFGKSGSSTLLTTLDSENEVESYINTDHKLIMTPILNPLSTDIIESEINVRSISSPVVIEKDESDNDCTELKTLKTNKKLTEQKVQIPNHIDLFELF
jgi:hypothetical protein